MNIVIIKYNAGNTQSVLYALERIGYTAEVTDDKEKIRKADKIIFPGVGAASSAMQYLREKELDKLILGLQQPFLGICLGMQLMCKSSAEGETSCLGIFEEEIKKFSSSAYKVPQIGWNTIFDLKSSLFDDVNENEFIYLVHSYYAATGKDTIAKANYILDYSAALHKNNFYGVQFHPEKSAQIGEQIIKNFIEKI